MIRFILAVMFLCPTFAFAESDEYGNVVAPSPSAVDQLVLINSPFIISGGSWGFSINWKFLIAGYMPHKTWMKMMIETDPKYVELVNDPTPDPDFEGKKKDLYADLYAKYKELWKIKIRLWEFNTRRPYMEGKGKFKFDIPI